jgi:hypothetical protein
LSASIVVVILVAVGEASAPTTATIVAAAAESLGPTASLVVRETANPNDVDAMRLENELHAVAVVQIVWANSARTRVKLRLHRSRYNRWVDREVAFLPEDSLRERNRALGFALGSMLLPESESLRKTTTNPSASEPAAEVSRTQREPPPRKAAAPPWESATESGRTLALPTPSQEDEPAPRPRAVRRQRVEPDLERERERGEPGPEVAPEAGPKSGPPSELFAIDLTAIGATGFGGPATAYGGALQIERFVRDTLWWGARAAVRNGSVPAQNGHDLVVSLMTGGSWRPFLPTAARPFHLGVGLQAGMFLHNFSHETSSSVVEYKQRLVAGMAAAADGGWRLTALWDVIVGVGLEMAFGTTEVTVAGRLVATIPTFRGLVAAGVRYRF